MVYLHDGSATSWLELSLTTKPVLGDPWQSIYDRLITPLKNTTLNINNFTLFFSSLNVITKRIHTILIAISIIGLPVHPDNSAAASADIASSNK